ncbi:MAG: thiamine pyrophosphate-dependent dehydrogenase E1 component subunit alpha, partial [Chloroflexi bacterium]
MVMARAIDRRLWTLSQLGGVLPIHGEVAAARRAPAGGADTGRETGVGRSTGFEAVQVAAAAALRPGLDWVVPSHRDLALCLAMGTSPLDVMLATLGRGSDQTSAGRQEPGSFGSRRARIITTSALTGAQIPHAAGIAYASKINGLDEVTLASIGERGTDTGDWHEGINFAAVHRLPLVCLVQNDAPRATAPPGQVAIDLIAKRADGYGIAAESIDGGDFDVSFDALCRAV